MLPRCKSGNGLIFLLLHCLMSFVTLLVLLCPTIGWGQDSFCPQSISVKQTIDKVPGGWTAAQGKQPNNLSGITFYDGPPEQEASLAYDQWIRTGSIAIAKWQFEPSSSIWIACHYSATSIVLQKQLPPKTSKCTVIYDTKVTVDGNPEIQKITCP
jgi:hypothetical protein